MSWNPYTDWVKIGDLWWSTKDLDLPVSGVSPYGVPFHVEWNGSHFYSIDSTDSRDAVQAVLPAGCRLPLHVELSDALYPFGGFSVCSPHVRAADFAGDNTTGLGIQAHAYLRRYSYDAEQYPQDADGVVWGPTPPDPVPVYNFAMFGSGNYSRFYVDRTTPDIRTTEGIALTDAVTLRVVRDTAPPAPPAVTTPTVTSVTPYQAARGWVVTLAGTNLQLVDTLELTGGPALPILSQSFGSLSFTIPLGVDPGPYSLDLVGTYGTVTAGGLVVSDLPGLPAYLPLARGVSDYVGLLLDLLPKGPAWTRKPSSYMAKLFSAMSDELVRVHNRAADVLTQATPSHAVESLGEWETELGVPGPCAGSVAPSESARRWEIFRKANALGGCTAAYLQELAALLGYPVTVTDLYPTAAPFKVGQSQVGEALNQGASLFSFLVSVTLPPEAISVFTVGTGKVGQPLRWWALEELECLVDSVKPAHTLAVYEYDTPT